MRSFCDIVHMNTNRRHPIRDASYFSAPSGRMFQRVKVPNPPDSGKDIAKSKGVLGNWESEGSWRQITGLTNRNHEG